MWPGAKHCIVWLRKEQKSERDKKQEGKRGKAPFLQNRLALTRLPAAFLLAKLCSRGTRAPTTWSGLRTVFSADHLREGANRMRKPVMMSEKRGKHASLR